MSPSGDRIQLARSLAALGSRYGVLKAYADIGSRCGSPIWHPLGVHFASNWRPFGAHLASKGPQVGPGGAQVAQVKPKRRPGGPKMRLKAVPESTS